MEKFKYIKIIDDYINGISSSFFDIYLLGSKTDILNYLKKYAIKYPNNIDKINYIIENLDNLLYFKFTEEQLKKVFEIKTKYSALRYIDEIKEILFIPEDEAMRILYKKNMNLNTLKRYITSFKNNFPLQVDEINKLDRISEKYSVKTTTKQKSYVNLPLLTISGKEIQNKELNIFRDLIESNTSIEEFCSKTGCSISQVKKICQKYIESNEDIINYILKKDTTEFRNYIKELGKSILLNDNFTRLDYYLSTSLRYEDFRNILFEILPKEEVLMILRNINKVFKLKQTAYFNKDIELEKINTINGRVITKEEIIRIFKFIEENNIPIDLYRTILNKYAYGELDIEKIKKKY